jgi:opacity protein-like surface antigen
MKRIGRWSLALAAVLALPALGAERDCYVGVLGAGALGVSQHHNSAGVPVTDRFDLKGGALGANAGCVWKANRNGYGVEADFSGLKIKGSTPQVPPFDTSVTGKTVLDRLATVRAVLGYETRPDWFAYGTAGIATAIGTVSACPDDGSDCASEEKRLWGLALGLGAEYAMSPGMRLRLEYLFVGFNKTKFLDSPPAGLADRGGGVEADVHFFRAGITLHF